MGRIRTIKPEFFKHEELFEAEQKTRLPLRVAFIGLWCASDREGRFRWKPNTLKLDVLPYDKCDFEKVLFALCDHGFICQYEEEGKYYGVIPSFIDHQVINNRESHSSLPVPNKFSRVATRAVTRHGLAQGEGKGKEGNKEGEGSLGTPKQKLCLFRESLFFDFEKFELSFRATDYENFNLKYYYEAVLNWSDSKGEKKLDWIATARGFMQRDAKDGKAALKGQNLIQYGTKPTQPGSKPILNAEAKHRLASKFQSNTGNGEQQH